MAEKIAAFIVHGFVQGVGYRAFVKGIADRLGVRGVVKNLDDGSVLIVAAAEPDVLDALENDIKISMKYGVQVKNVERYSEGDSEFPKDEYEFDGFKIIK